MLNCIAMSATTSQHSHRAAIALACGLCALLVLALHLRFVPYQQLEMIARDALVRFARRAQPDPQLVYLAIDDASVNIGANAFSDDPPAIQKMGGAWPWSRAVHAMILEKLAQAGARVVAFDLLFPTSGTDDAAWRAALDRYQDRVVL